MRIYDGSPRQDYEEVLRSVGAHLDERAMKDILVLEVPDGFVVQGLALTDAGRWSEEIGRRSKETLVLVDDDLARFMDEALARRGRDPRTVPAGAGYYEHALRAVGRYIDGRRPRDLFLFEQEGAFVLRLLVGTAGGDQHELVEFTREDIEALVAQGPSHRGGDAGHPGSGA